MRLQKCTCSLFILWENTSIPGKNDLIRKKEVCFKNRDKKPKISFSQLCQNFEA